MYVYSWGSKLNLELLDNPSNTYRVQHHLHVKRVFEAAKASNKNLEPETNKMMK